jgi:hypothetical protein
MPNRWLPLAPDLDQLRHQAKDLLHNLRRAVPEAIAEFRAHHPRAIAPEDAQLADAQLALARTYGVASWSRLIAKVRMVHAIWKDDVETVRKLAAKHPAMLHEDINPNWGPPMSFAANVGRDRIIDALRDAGAKDFEYAMRRAVLQGRIETARRLHKMAGSPKPPRGALGSPAYTLSVTGTQFLFDIGVEMVDEDGVSYAPVDVVIDSDSRAPERKHRILEMYAEHGFEYPDTPMMAVHRGRIDLLEAHIDRDPGLLERTFSYAEICPPELRCGQPKNHGYDERLPRTPISGTSLLHVCIEFAELGIARWLLERGMDPNIRAAVDANGFGGHTPMFNALVSYPHFWMNFTGGWPGTQKPLEPTFARLLLDYGADPNARASLREPGGTEEKPAFRDHHDITPLRWAEVFRDRMIVNGAAVKLIEERRAPRRPRERSSSPRPRH